MTHHTADDAGANFAALLALMATLRSEDGCPWDREQTHASLKRYLIEEAYELLEAVDQGDDRALAEELGDVLLQVIFHAQIAAETGRFTMNDVIAGLSDKLVRRHPHVFGNVQADDADAVLRTWDEVKRRERGDAGSKPESLLGSVPRALPALMEAEKIQQRAARVGFQWDDVAGAWEKVQEELEELRRAGARIAPTLAGVDEDKRKPETREIPEREQLENLREAIADELGDVLFAVVNVARYLGVDPEESLRATNAKFRRRFGHIEARARAKGRRLEQMTLEEMDALWDEAKEKGLK